MRKFVSKFIGDRQFYRMVLMVAVPIMIQNGVTNFVSMLDNIMVGQIGTEQMSGVAIVNQLIFVYNLCIFGGLSGAGIFTAQFYGKQDTKGIQHTFRYKIWIALGLTVGAIVLFLVFGDHLIQMYLRGESNGGDLAAALQYGRGYLRIILLALPPFMLLQVYASTLRECGETILPMKASLAAVAVNMMFNYVLIFGKLGFPQLGVNGAAIATVLARYVEAAVVISWTHRHKKEHSYIAGIYRTMRVPLSLTKELIIKGAPLLINEALWSAGMAMLTQCYSVRGLNVVAALNISNTLNNMFNIVYIAMGNAVAIIVGRCLGAGEMEEARDVDNKIIVFSVFSSLVVALGMLVISPLFPQIYNTSVEVKILAARFIAVQAIFLPQAAFVNAAYFTLRSGGKTMVTFFFDCVFVWCVNVTTAYFLSRYTAIDAVYVLVFVLMTDFIKCIIGGVLVKKGVWINNLVEDTK